MDASGPARWRAFTKLILLAADALGAPGMASGHCWLLSVRLWAGGLPWLCGSSVRQCVAPGQAGGVAEPGPRARVCRGGPGARGIAPAAALKPSKEAAALAAGACHTGNTKVTPCDSAMTYGRLLGVVCVTGGGQRKMTTRSRVKEAGGILTEDVEI